MIQLISSPALLRTAMGAILFMIIPVSMDLYEEATNDIHHWVSYDRLEVREIFPEADYIPVYSFSEVKRPVRVQWIDTLYCRLDETRAFEFVASQTSEKKYNGPDFQPRVELNSLGQEI